MSSTDQQQALQNYNAYRRAIARAWGDPDEKKRFLQDPRMVLLKEGFVFPPDVTVTAVENTNRVLYAIADPAWSTDTNVKAALMSSGVPIPPGVEVKVLKDSASLMHVVLPLAPTMGELSEEDLEKVAGGSAQYWGRYGYGYRRY